MQPIFFLPSPSSPVPPPSPSPSPLLPLFPPFPPLPPSPFQVLSEPSITEDHEVRDFLVQLVSRHLNRESRYARFDLLLCPLAGTPPGEQLLKKLRPLLAIPVFMSADVLGPCISEAEG